MALRPSRRDPAPAEGEPWRLERVPHPELPLRVVTDAAGALVSVHFGEDETRARAWAADCGAVLTVEVEQPEEAVVAEVVAGGPRPRPRPAHRATRQPPASAAARQLAEYLAGRRTAFDLQLRLIGSPFQRAVWEALRAIPFGETRSYGDIARAVGRPGGSRAVGQANGANHMPIVVPCHRVVAASGALGGFSSGLGNKRWLLAHEAAQTKLPLPDHG